MKKIREYVRKYALIAAVAVGTAAGASALPGYTPYLADRSGEFVYYRDYTFSRESYAGFLVYDNKTFAARYYAPADQKQKLTEKSLVIYFTIDPSLDHIELTGERIASAVTPDDGDVINYLHDMVYELASRRAKAGVITPATAPLFSGLSYPDAGYTVTEDFPQFGGTVDVLFDYLVPVFNVKKITANDNTVLLRVVTTGVLTSAGDTSFTGFTGFPDKLNDGKRNWKPASDVKKSVYSLQDHQTVTLDSGWSQSMENLWLLGDTALLSVSSIKASDEPAPLRTARLLRMMMQSTENSYDRWQDLSVKQQGTRYAVDSTYFQPETGTVLRSFKIVTGRKDGSSTILLLTVFNSVYQTNHQYFDAILSQYAPGE